MVEAFESMGLAAQKHEFWAYLSSPIEAEVEVITPEARIGLPIREAMLVEDPDTASADHPIGFNAYSGSGDVTAEVVYANYGTKSDFEKLKQLGIDCTGKIIIARYGGNFRGYKAKFAQQAGAIGLIIFTDPGDSGYRKGPPYPEGGWANDTHIQRGSINTLPYPGDPLTPGTPATKDAARMNPDQIALPRIPVQPIGYKAAEEIISRMQGVALPPELGQTWQGGLPCAYRLTGGADLKVRLKVKQERAIVHTANVIATLEGAAHPEQKIIIGCHHDAWGCGASDPLAGTILVFEAARSFAQAAKAGHRPLRTIVFATWGAEEHGIVGSTEYCEQYKDDLIRNAVAYINLDMAAMGPNFGSSAAPLLKRIIEEVARDVPHLQGTAETSVHQTWIGGSGEASFGNLGGGSDHVGFYCHLGIPSCSLGAGGAPGTSYHSTYDTLAWYRKVVGDDYAPALMLTRMVNLLAARLASAPLLPLEPSRYGRDFSAHAADIAQRAVELKVDADFKPLIAQAQQLQRDADRVQTLAQTALATGDLPGERLDAINATLIAMERRWLATPEQSAAERASLEWLAWYRNLFAISDPDSGYASWLLPMLRSAVESRDSARVQSAMTVYRSVLNSLAADVQQIEHLLHPDSR